MGETSYRYRCGVSREADFRFVAGNSSDGDHESERERERERIKDTETPEPAYGMGPRQLWLLMAIHSVFACAARIGRERS